MDVLQLPRSEAPARMEALAKLPVFWALEGKRCIVVGGSDAAAWKAELLASCGAHVEIFAETLSETFEILLARPPVHGSAMLMHRREECGKQNLAGATLAIGDFDDEAEAALFFEATREAGVPVNVIDKPAYCQFQFGSIVNRSPAIIAISTDGAAPILAQAIRRRIETLLPGSLKAWAALAQTIRERVHALLEPGAPRRAFWEKFADRAFNEGKPPQDLVVADLMKEAAGIAHAVDKGGSVTLVGAGPGDAELLTLKAVRALQAADVILFDDLVSDEVLELARREAKRMLVGKRGGRESCRQEDINDMMVKLAKAGKRVVRLKSGDPMIFGRAGEEIAHLQGEGIPVDVIPGITAASAMASRLGISLTHRDHAQSVRFTTGHSRHGDMPKDIDWRSMADSRTTNVFYMGGRTAPAIAKRMITEGVGAQTPAVIINNVSRPNEHRWTGTLENLAIGIREIGYDQPVLIAIGNALGALREQDDGDHVFPNMQQATVR
ncbi:uroporphyrin-III C-methyltransferase/precorrin-2 dehydrogenase/sirohydrochlorin ferrochelatase [Pararhizobium capsulatum DSM 1112]|uniref:Uroporphyrin-III C-methyltransferase/precorrin-2 dehydrogenase/sirohydrochlorin ferrochelatase n=1 Tax=Pararhizobium capsulatum DSM 1112 TaxID=1121113 RepID=A0ABU0BYT8_9HYPH|nr:siroheme synthase CysG [Pararhizobium capsulatum]MDQ0322821.1 uroporphyrin-III C-methyltransferase/precorrin-2 dehydrogenase/sirohydrochlorin ferrochelatase [Pararhizobium capsulatum DSM 1112]